MKKAKVRLELEFIYDIEKNDPVLMHSIVSKLVKKFSEDTILDGYKISHKIIDKGTSEC